MAKITHCSNLDGTLSYLEEIPSEFIEPYISKYFGMVIESVGLGFDTPEEARQRLKGVDRFISIFGGLHSRLATSNQVYAFCKMSDEEILNTCKEACKNY